MSQQSLEELTSIYSEASELGLTTLGVTEPQQEQEGGGDMKFSAAATLLAAEAEQGSRVQGSREQEDYYSNMVS